MASSNGQRCGEEPRVASWLLAMGLASGLWAGVMVLLAAYVAAGHGAFTGVLTVVLLHAFLASIFVGGALTCARAKRPRHARARERAVVFLEA